MDQQKARGTEKSAAPLLVGVTAEGSCVRWIDKGFGYGFVAVRGAADVFVPARSLLRIDRLRPGDRVRFETRMGRDGRIYADSVEVLQ